MYMYDVVGKVKLNKPGICLLYMYNDNYYHEEKWFVIKSFFLRFFFSLGKILYIRFIKFISSNQDIVAKQCKNIHYMHMEYENVVLKRPTTGYEHGRKERLEIVQMVDGNSTLPAQQINVAEEPCQQLSLTGNGLYFTLCRTAVSMVKNTCIRETRW